MMAISIDMLTWKGDIKLASIVGEVIGQKVEGDIVIFLNGHVVKLPSNCLCP